MLNVISLGAGVQSSTMLLMALTGELERPDHVIFADTGWEPRAVYAHLDYLEAQCREADVPLHRVSAGNIREDTLSGRLPSSSAAPGEAGEAGFATMPLHLRSKTGGHGMLRRQCTHEYKVRPIRAKIRQLGANRTHPVRLWIGISFDEIHRLKGSNVRYIVHDFPLVDRRMRRTDCIRWCEERSFPVGPKSACVCCPFKDNARWQQQAHGDPEEWRQVMAFDEAIRNLRRIDGQVFLHRSLRPLAEIDFATAEEQGQLTFDELGFGNECEGLCGV